MDRLVNMALEQSTKRVSTSSTPDSDSQSTLHHSSGLAQAWTEVNKGLFKRISGEKIGGGTRKNRSLDYGPASHITAGGIIKKDIGQGGGTTAIDDMVTSIKKRWW